MHKMYFKEFKFMFLFTEEIKKLEIIAIINESCKSIKKSKMATIFSN